MFDDMFQLFSRVHLFELFKNRQNSFIIAEEIADDGIGKAGEWAHQGRIWMIYSIPTALRRQSET